MIPALLFVFGLAYIGLRVGDAIRTGQVSVGADPAPRKLPARKYSYLALVDYKLRAGMPITPFQLHSALREAWDREDWQKIARLTTLLTPGTEAQESQPEVGAARPESRPSALTSPIEGVDDESWAEFTDRLRTRDPSHQAGRRVGAWEQNLDRLAKLGLDTPADPESQYDAFCADVTDYHNTQRGLIQEYSGEVVQIPGMPNPDSADGSWAVTASGVLGLLKCAGPEGAKSWLDNQDDRARYPYTTQTFIRANGCF